MCGKEGYQSIRYIQEECNKSKKRFNSRINQFILEYKGKEEEEPPNKLIEALIINYRYTRIINVHEYHLQQYVYCVEVGS